MNVWFQIGKSHTWKGSCPTDGFAVVVSTVLVVVVDIALRWGLESEWPIMSDYTKE